ncbi:CBS domain-containing protein [Methylobacterium sp. 88A]|uniref:CBS domain-containing protein n=1 Tax=Methylobacterium sp. 88A TaxID=1131813 RepID=UPI00036BC666|nr:CBS domain-containing protein [Methylobacterium sp. 88A]
MTMASDDERYAFGLYLYNARLAKAFLFPLQMAEVALRNAVVEALVGSFGENWPSDPGFVAWLEPGGHDAIAKADRRLVVTKGPGYPVSQLVATLTFDFWSHLLRNAYERPFWQRHFRKVLPNVPARTLRRDVHRTVKAICQFRNRVSHHEPILNENAPAILAAIIELIEMRCTVTAGWTTHYCTVGSVVGTKPAGPASATGRTVGMVCDGSFVTASPEENLLSALSRLDETKPALVILDEAGTPAGVLRHEDVLAQLAGAAAKGEGLVLLTEHTVGGVAAGLPRNWLRLDAGDHLSKVAESFKRNKSARTVVVTDTVNGASTLKGVILKAHRRY